MAEYECPWGGCNPDISTRQGLGSHMSAKHGVTLREYEGEGGDHKCPSCEKSFGTRQGLGQHHANHHGESIRAHEQNSRAYGCPICDYRSDSRQGIGQHMSLEHNTTLREHESSEGDLKCEFDECDFTTSSENGLFVHYGVIHDHRPNDVEVECTWCGGTLTRERYQVEGRKWFFCDGECEGSWRSENLTGEDHPNWKREITITCRYCGDKKRVPPSRSDGQFCGRECFQKWNGESDHNKKENHPLWVGREDITCGACGTEFPVRAGNPEGRKFCSSDCGDVGRDAPSGSDHYLWGGDVETECIVCGEMAPTRPGRDGARKFCSPECHGIWRSENSTGDDNPAWRGGKSVYDAVKKLIGPVPFWHVKEPVRKAAGNECEWCALPASENGRELDVHHIVPVMTGGTNAPGLQMALCRKHHPKAESYMRRHFESHLVDWTGDELPDGRLSSREYMDQIEVGSKKQLGQSELTDFAAD